jgi:hypothetical protein
MGWSSIIQEKETGGKAKVRLGNLSKKAGVSMVKLVDKREGSWYNKRDTAAACPKLWDCRLFPQREALPRTRREGKRWTGTF